MIINIAAASMSFSASNSILYAISKEENGQYVVIRSNADVLEFKFLRGLSIILYGNATHVYQFIHEPDKRSWSKRVCYP